MPTALPSLEEFASATADVLSQTPIEVHDPVFVFESGVVALDASRLKPANPAPRQRAGRRSPHPQARTLPDRPVFAETRL